MQNREVWVAATLVELSETLGNEIVVNEKIIDPPEQQFAKRRVIQVRVNIENRRAMDHVGDRFAKGCGGVHGFLVKPPAKTSIFFRDFGDLLISAPTGILAPCRA